jgi:dienelactone hydrolase
MVTAKDIEYSAGGLTMNGRLALPEGTGQRPGVLIAHEGNGLDEFQRSRPERLAELGYVAFALDYHGGGRVYTDPQQVMARLGELSEDLDHIRALGRAGLEVLASQARTDPAKLAAIGYCFGGTLVLELARGGADLKAVVGFHPGLTTSKPQDSVNISGKVLVCIGAEDPFASLEQRTAFEQDMRTGGVDWQMNLYGGTEHSFTHPRAGADNADHMPGLSIPGLSYHQNSDQRSWRAMLDLFDEVFD